MEGLAKLEAGQLSQLFALAHDYNQGDLTVLKRVPASKRRLFTAMLNFIRSHLPLQWTELGGKLGEEGWSQPQREALLSEFGRVRSGVERLRGPARVVDFRWRVDVSLSTNSLAKVLKPEVLFLVRTTTGPVQFHLSVRQFTELRRSTAALLRDLQALDQFVFIKSIK